MIVTQIFCLTTIRHKEWVLRLFVVYLAPKYILEMEGLGLYVAEKQGLTGCNLTSSQNEAMKYSVGFDNESIKLGIWTSIVKRMMNTDVEFNVVYL